MKRLSVVESYNNNFKIIACGMAVLKMRFCYMYFKIEADERKCRENSLKTRLPRSTSVHLSAAERLDEKLLLVI